MHTNGHESFQPAWWCRNRHLQTLWPVVCRRRGPLSSRRERLELPDGDFLDLDWVEPADDAVATVVILHGLRGSIESPYVRGMLRRLGSLRLRGVLMHFRGCSGMTNRLPRAYHAGETDDFRHTLDLVRKRFGESSPVAAIGYSLGANVLLNFLGRFGSEAGLAAAASVCPPLDLARISEHMNRGGAKFYQWYLMRALRRALLEKMQNVEINLALDEQEVRTLRTFTDFDNRVTAPLHGFAGAHHYYSETSAGRLLHGIRVPTLLLHARDDPFMPGDLPLQLGPASDHLELEVTPGGGHVGFVSGRNPLRPRYWLEERVPAFLADHLHQAQHPVPEPIICRSQGSSSKTMSSAVGGGGA